MQQLSQGNTPANPAPHFANNENVARFREGQVYAVIFSDGWLKVGRGRNPESRIASHASVSAMRNATVLQSVVSGKLADSGSAENSLIAFCEAHGTSVHGREWFVGVDFSLISEMFIERFAGDPEELIASARAQQDQRVKVMLDSVLRTPEATSSPTTPCMREQLKWAEALAHARILERLYLDDMYSGWLFEPSTSGMSNFGNYASLVINGMGDAEIADLFYGAATNPGEALEQVTSIAQSLIEEFRKQGES